MPIPISEYVDITSGVGGASAFRLREYILRDFTSNPLLPTNSMREFSSATAVGDYFGTDSVEYDRAAFYFGFVSKNLTSPTKICFARYNDADTAPLIWGGRSGTQAAFNGVSNGSFVMTINGTSNVISGLNFTPSCSPVTLANVASIIQNAIRTAGTGEPWEDCTVTYDATRAAFNFNGVDTGNYTIAVSAHTSGTNILTSTYLNWGAQAIFSDGVVASTPLPTVIASAEASDNFGAFSFIDSLSTSNIELLAEWNEGQNVKYMYLVPAEAADESTLSTLLMDIGGVGVTEIAVADEYPELCPAAILASTDFSRANATTNYMFNQFNLTPTVTTLARSQELNEWRINYYGQTQKGGQNVSFYQRGVLMGGLTDPTDMGVYANEIWLKDSAATDILNLLLALPNVSADAQGRADILGALQNTIDAALNNGAISVNKTFTNTQKIYITNITGSDTAWQQIKTTGYWVDCVISSYVTLSGLTEYKAEYILVYSKNDSIRKVEGTHTLI